ncbi:Uncharacterised protein [Vibrio cholerae]|nr:Uncharacterised protein [Vibrio cholerae]CSC25404.1 Uncharacterised protein [Vibrio cholerae]
MGFTVVLKRRNSNKPAIPQKPELQKQSAMTRLGHGSVMVNVGKRMEERWMSAKATRKTATGGTFNSKFFIITSIQLNEKAQWSHWAFCL